MKRMNQKEVFERVREHLLTQKEKAMDRGLCKHRTEDGKKCAIGILIADEYYSVGLEGTGPLFPVLGEVLKKSLKVDELTLQDRTLLGKLMTIHDNEPVSQWAVSLAKIEEAIADGVYV